MIKKRVWTKETAVDYALSVELGKAPRGLKYCSAISYLGVFPGELLEKATEKATAVAENNEAKPTEK